MLDRIGGLMIELRQVTDDVAHDLKTPLTRLRNRAEEALRKAKTDDEYRATLDEVIDESDGLIRTFNTMLVIARAESDTRSHHGAGRCFGVDRERGGAIRAPGRGDEVELKVRAVAGAKVHGNRELLARL